MGTVASFLMDSTVLNKDSEASLPAYERVRIAPEIMSDVHYLVDLIDLIHQEVKETKISHASFSRRTIFPSERLGTTQ